MAMLQFILYCHTMFSVDFLSTLLHMEATLLAEKDVSLKLSSHAVDM